MTFAEQTALIAAASETMHYDEWTQSYRDRYNDVFVSRHFERKLWVVASRGRGNRTMVHSRHRNITIAIATADKVATARSMGNAA